MIKTISLTQYLVQVYVICRLGNDSQHAVRMLRDTTRGEIKDVIGGLYRWAMEVDKDFPTY